MDLHFAGAAAGVLERTRQAAMVASVASGNVPTVMNGMAQVPSNLQGGPASESAGNGSPTSTTVFSPPPTDTTANVNNPWGSAFTINGTRVTIPVIAGIVIGCIAACGIVAVAVHRRVAKRRALAEVATPPQSAVNGAETGSAVGGATSNGPPPLLHHRQSLLGWLQRVAEDVPPPTPR